MYLMRIITRHQVNHISRQIASPDYHDMVQLMFELGLRISELIYLKRSYIDLASRTVYISGKGKKVRLLPLNRLAYLICRRHLRKNRKIFLFESSYGYHYPVRSFREVIYKASKLCSYLFVHPHTLRHSRATDLINSGCDLWHVKQLLGHEDIRTTSIYLHYSIEGLRKAIA